MTTQLYTVTLTDLGTYQITVAADTPREAELVAREILHDEAVARIPGLSNLKREIDATVELAPPPIRTYRVHATYSLDFSMSIPANSPEEAKRHAQRLYQLNSGPFEFDHDGDRVSAFNAEAVS